MIIGHIPGFTRTIGESQGYRGLPLKDVLLADNAHSVRDVVPAMQTLWHPSPDELRTLIEGGGIVLTILGSAHPPVNIDVVPRKEFDPMSDRTTPDEAVMAEGQTVVTTEEK